LNKEKVLILERQQLNVAERMDEPVAGRDHSLYKLSFSPQREYSRKECKGSAVEWNVCKLGGRQQMECRVSEEITL
jgi:hypothetical protein